jgi:hypothetical protein
MLSIRSKLIEACKAYDLREQKRYAKNPTRVYWNPSAERLMIERVNSISWTPENQREMVLKNFNGVRLLKTLL